MKTLILHALICLLWSSGSISQDYQNIDIEKVAIEPFPIYQNKDNDTIIDHILVNDRIRLLFKEKSTNRWTLVKSKNRYIGWAKWNIIEKSTREPSLEYGEPVSKAEADLDGNGIKEKIEVLPDRWSHGYKLYINDEYKLNIYQPAFLIVELDENDKYKEIFTCFHRQHEPKSRRFGTLYSYRDGVVKQMNSMAVPISGIQGNGIIKSELELPISKTVVSYEVDQSKGIFTRIKEDVMLVDFEAKANENFSLYLKAGSKEKIGEVIKGQKIRFVSSRYIYVRNTNYPGGDYYWYLIRTEDEMEGWAESRFVKHLISYEDDSAKEQIHKEQYIVDLNGNGIMDKVSIDMEKEITQTYDSNIDSFVEYVGTTGEYTLHINDVSINDHIGDNCSGFMIVDVLPDDDFKEVVVRSFGQGAYIAYSFYRYDGNDIIEIGQLTGNKWVREGYVHNEHYQHTGFVSRKYVINSDTGLLEEVVPNLYYNGIWALVCNNITLYDSHDMKHIKTILKKGQLLKIIGFIEDESAEEYFRYGFSSMPSINYWCLVQTESGILGWVKISQLEKSVPLPPHWM